MGTRCETAAARCLARRENRKEGTESGACEPVTSVSRRHRAIRGKAAWQAGPQNYKRHTTNDMRRWNTASLAHLSRLSLVSQVRRSLGRSAKDRVRQSCGCSGHGGAAFVRRCVSCLMSGRGLRLRFGPGALHHRPAAPSHGPTLLPGVPTADTTLVPDVCVTPCFLPSSDRARSPERQCPHQRGRPC